MYTEFLELCVLKINFMSHKTIKITGYTLTILLTLLFAFSAFSKLTLNATALGQATFLGIPAETYRLLGVLELISLVLFIWPRTGLVGSILLIAYMGGAIASGVQHLQPVMIPVIIEVLLWSTVAIRFPEVLQRLSRSTKNSIPSNLKTS
jgi:DoxX-like family